MTLVLWMSAWAQATVAIVIAMPSAGAPLSNAAAKPTAKAPAATVRSSAQLEETSGFLLEGEPQIDMVFGDTFLYRKQLDGFFVVEAEMTRAREDFAEATHRAMTILSQIRQGCPADPVAIHYAKARVAREQFRRGGATLEKIYRAVVALDQLGESAGLTPDYRWKVQQAREAFSRSIDDHREMGAAFSHQLESELKSRKCKLEALLKHAAQTTAAPENGKPSAPARTASPEQTPAIVMARTATFFVDNSACHDAISVVVDGTLLGQVAEGTKAAFQADMGRHMICLLGATDVAECGEAGTVRTGFIHDGYAIVRDCTTN